MAETTATECLFKFCRAIIEVFGEVYLRRPNDMDVQRSLQMYEGCHGFPAGANNDLNVLSRSTLFQEVLQGRTPNVEFQVNDTQYNMGYYLLDDIYPEWDAFVKAFPNPQDPKRKKFKERQESARKDVERAFGVLQARCAMVRGPARHWHKQSLHDIMYACIILHNMIVEDERHTYRGNFPDEIFSSNIGPEVRNGHAPGFEEYLATNASIRDRQIHHQLKHDLVEHIWERFGDK